MIAILVAASIDALGHKQIFIALLQFACYIQRESVRSCNAASSRRMNRRLDYSLIHRAVTSDESSVGSPQSRVFGLEPIIYHCFFRCPLRPCVPARYFFCLSPAEAQDQANGRDKKTNISPAEACLRSKDRQVRRRWGKHLCKGLDFP